MVVLAVNSYPLTRLNASEQAQVKVHKQRRCGMQFQATVRQTAMQINGCKEDRHL
jgi:hypothetical protein